MARPSNRRITICQVLHTLNVGGAEVLAVRLAKRLHDDFRFVFACLDELGSLGEQLRKDGHSVSVIGRKEGFDFRCALELARFLRRERVDIIQAHQYGPFFYSMMARLFYRRPSILFTEHGRAFPDYRRPKRVLVNRFLIARRDRIVAVGERVRQAIIDNEGIPFSRIRIIYNGIETERFSITNDVRSEIRKELGLDSGHFAVIQVARLNYLKDHLTAVRTIERAIQTKPNVRLLLVGEGEEGGRIHDEILNRNLSEFIHLLGLRRDIPRLCQAADAMLLTSISEGIPLTLIEGMASRLPIVATAVGGVREVIPTEDIGLLAGAGDDETLARHILNLEANPLLRQQLGDRGKCRAQEVFHESKMVDEYRKLFVSMILH